MLTYSATTQASELGGISFDYWFYGKLVDA